MSSFWATLNTRIDDLPSHALPNGVDNDASDLDEYGPDPVTDVDSDCEGVGPPPMVADSQSDESDRESDAVPGRETAADIEAEYAVPEQVAMSGRRKYTFKKRAQKVEVRAKRNTSTQAGRASTEAAKDVVLIGRCRQRCCFSVQSEQLEPALLAAHHEFRSKSGGARTEWLSTILANVNLAVPKPFKARLGKDNVELCPHCFKHLHGIPKSTMHKNMQRAQAGIKVTLGGNKGGRESHIGTSSAPLLTKWLKEYADVAADVWPHKQHVTLPEFTWKAVYDKCMRELTFSSATYQTFMAAKEEGCSHIKVRTHNGMGKCDDCTRLKELIDKHQGLVKKKWEAEKAKHDDWHMRERLDKYKCIEKAKGIYKPGWVRNCIYVESDSMDQAKTQIPHSAEESKVNAELEKLQLHVTIVRIFNGDEDHIFTYVWPAYLSGGSDASITFILDALGRITIPPTVTKLYAFTDNAGGEYKNRFVMALWHCLVERDLFLKIKHSFLGVGHTHDWIVDGIFKHFAAILQHSQCFTAADLMRLIGDSRGKDGKTAKPIVILSKVWVRFRLCFSRCW
jgi:hypothetical protein